MYTYTINYYRFDGNYDNWNLWLWQTGGEGKGYDFNKKMKLKKDLQEQSINSHLIN